jgi:hypothetical protein
VCRAAGSLLPPGRRYTAPLELPGAHPARYPSSLQGELDGYSRSRTAQSQSTPEAKWYQHPPRGRGRGARQRSQLTRGAVPTTTPSESRTSSPRLSGATACSAKTYLLCMPANVIRVPNRGAPRPTTSSPLSGRRDLPSSMPIAAVPGRQAAASCSRRRSGTCQLAGVQSRGTLALT